MDAPEGADHIRERRAQSIENRLAEIEQYFMEKNKIPDNKIVMENFASVDQISKTFFKDSKKR